jgi:hypothetical protein
MHCAVHLPEYFDCALQNFEEITATPRQQLEVDTIPHCLNAQRFPP